MPAYATRRAASGSSAAAEPARADANADAQTLYGNAFLSEQMAPDGDIGPEDPLWYGIVQNDALDATWADRAVELGAGSIKVRLKDSDVLTAGEPMFDFLVACRERGLEVVVLFNHESVGTDYANPDLDKCRARAEEVVTGIGHLVDAWEVWNEPQSIEPVRDMAAEDLMRVLGTAYPVFAKTGAPVLAAPEWVTGNGDRFREDMAAWWNDNRGEYPEVEGEWPFDIMAVHAYFLDGWDPTALIDESMRNVSDTFGADMPVWVTEFGYPGGDEAHQARQADFVGEIAGAFAKHAQVDRMHWYSLKDYPGDESGAQMGMHREDGTAKPAAERWGHGKASYDTGTWSIPRPELEGMFRAHLDAIGASGQLDAAHWNEWYGAYLANGGDAAHAHGPAPGPEAPSPAEGGGEWSIPRPELEAMFLTHLDAIGAPGEVDAAHWNEWYAAYEANGGDAAHL